MCLSFYYYYYYYYYYFNISICEHFMCMLQRNVQLALLFFHHTLTINAEYLFIWHSQKSIALSWGHIILISGAKGPFYIVSSVAHTEMTCKPNRFLLVNTTNLHYYLGTIAKPEQDIFSPHTKLPVAWIYIQMTGFCIKLLPDNSKYDHIFYRNKDSEIR